ncbi:phage tail protein, partial [Parapedobacter indicus]
MIYEIKRGNTVLAAVHAEGVQDVSVMENDRAEHKFQLPVHVDFKRGDTVEVYGQIYKINRSANVGRTNEKQGLGYEIEFEALYYDLAKWQLKGLDAANELTVSEVYLTGTASTVIDLIVRNANRVDSGWEIGVVDDTEAQQFTFVNQSLLAVLTELASRFESEYWVDGKVIHLQKREASTGLSLEFGKGKGLYKLTRGRTETSVINRLYVEGASRNLPSGYGF